MNRATILIGVSNAQGLTRLHAVSDGIKNMKQWALNQGMANNHVVTLTDDEGPVSGDDVEIAVLDLLKNDTLEQLIIYFAGHGVTVDFNQVWYLSRALESPSQAINVRATITRAGYCGLNHVVLISDACRTHPDTVQGMGTMGRALFPNPKAGAKKTFVDVFYATQLGAPSNEIDNKKSSEGFRAIFTDSVLHAIQGKQKDICEADENLGLKVVRPWPLRKFLQDDVPARYLKLTNSIAKTQEPDADILSPPTSWISDVTNTSPPANPESFHPSVDEIIAIQSARSPMTASHELLGGLIKRDGELPMEAVMGMIREKEAELREEVFEREFEDNTVEHLESFGPMEFESQCGFKIRGAKIVKVHGKVDFRIHDDQQAVGVSTTKPGSVLLVFDNGYGALLSAIPEYIGSITVSTSPESSAESKIVISDVYFEPDRNSYRYRDFEKRKNQIRGLRAVIATSVQRGNFRLQEEDAAKLSRKMQLGKRMDPSLALYSAHGYSRIGDEDHLREMYSFLSNDLGRVPMDVALLAEEALGRGLDDQQFVPFLPMLSQSWGLLPAYDIKFPTGLEGVDRHLVTGSLWTLFTPEGVGVIQNAIQQGDLN